MKSSEFTSEKLEEMLKTLNDTKTRKNHFTFYTGKRGKEAIDRAVSIHVYSMLIDISDKKEEEKKRLKDMLNSEDEEIYSLVVSILCHNDA